MMVGHAMLAFALVSVAALAVGNDRERALALGVAAGAFATVPDVDMAYALLGAAQAQVTDIWAVTNAFWRSSQTVHRSITHSLVVAIPAALAFAWSASAACRGAGFKLPGSERSVSSHQTIALAVLAGLVGVAFVENGPLGGAVMSIFAIAGVAVAGATHRWASLSTHELLAVALVGLLSHPFGDLFTGSPPDFLYPLDAVLIESRIALSGDPTLNLLAIFGLELATVWLAVSAFCWLSGRRPAEFVDARATLGAAYGIAVLVLPAPTLSVSYHFVFSVLAVGTVGMAPRQLPLDRLHRSTEARPLLSWPSHEDCLAGALTGLAAITLGAATYAAGYVVSQAFLG